MDDEGGGTSPEPGQFCTVATLVAQAPNHPEFRQVIASLLTRDNGPLERGTPVKEVPLIYNHLFKTFRTHSQSGSGREDTKRDMCSCVI
jgi:hypothetical protein